MGQGIKGIIGIKGKIAILITLLLFVFSIFFLTAPKDMGVSGSISKNTEYRYLEKSEEDNHYYISFIMYQSDKKPIKLKCTKEQYEYMSDNEAEYHIFFSLNLFNKKTGKILELDDKPIYHGGVPISLYKEFNICL